MCSVYDPLGFTSLCILLAKLIQQDLSRRKFGWEEPVPESSNCKWEAWLKDLGKLERFKIPRCFTPPNFAEVQQSELHHFADASDQGYGAVLYLRQIDTNVKIHCSVVMSKSRFAALKTMTIPKMVLSAAARLDQMITQEITLPLATSTFRTGSTCVLHYLGKEDVRFQAFALQIAYPPY